MEEEEKQEGSPVIFIEKVVDTTSGEELDTEHFGEQVVNIIGTTPPEDVEWREADKMNIAHNKKLGYDVWYRVGLN